MRAMDKLIETLMKPTQQDEYLRPGTIWAHRVNGHWELVYLQSLSSRLIRNGSREVDFITPFGFEHLPREKFLSLFTPVTFARVTFERLASLDNFKMSGLKL